MRESTAVPERRFVVVQMSHDGTYYVRDDESGNLIGPFPDWSTADRVCQTENARVENEVLARWAAEHPPEEPVIESPFESPTLAGDLLWAWRPGEPRYVATVRKHDGLVVVADRKERLVKASWEDRNGVSWLFPTLEDAQTLADMWNAEERGDGSGAQGSPRDTEFLADAPAPAMTNRQEAAFKRFWRGGGRIR